MTQGRFVRQLIVAAACGLCAARASAQAPPPEMRAYVLMDVGPVKVPAACQCITAAFRISTPRPGWGHGDGPAAPEGDATPSKYEQALQATRVKEDRAMLLGDAEDGLAGNPHASISVAYQLTMGTATRRNDDEAIRWFHLAAQQEHPDAFIQLGHRYIRGIGVPQNHQAGAYWFHAGATRGDRNAMVALGLLYAAGRGVPQDWAAAVRWWQQAQSGGRNLLALRFLGDAYACGLGVPQDAERAVLAYRESAEGGEPSSSVQLGHMLASGCVRATDEEAARAYERAADRGDPEAQIALSELCRIGRGTEQNVYQAYMWARLAERRLPEGEMRSLANARAAQAAALLPAYLVADAEKMVDALIVESARSIR